MLDKTMIFSLGEEKDDQIKAGFMMPSAKKDITLLIRLWDIF